MEFVEKNMEMRGMKRVEIVNYKIPATVVILRCREDLIDRMIIAFRLRFLSAGG
ncbi:hypothetical protein [Clostridium sp.]|uniref:hypothetical protein n=1 Tax=Clostridium sp. TaxID=1506 RepID=UPI003D6CCA28